jgi:hypothetical protein
MESEQNRIGDPDYFVLASRWRKRHEECRIGDLGFLANQGPYY